MCGPSSGRPAGQGSPSLRGGNSPRAIKALSSCTVITGTAGIGDFGDGWYSALGGAL